MKERSLAQMGLEVGEHHGGEAKRETAEHEAKRIVGEQLDRQGWTGAQLARRRKGDPVKLALPVRLRRETTVTIGWIAKRLETDTRKSGATRLLEARHRSRLTPADGDNVMV